jgi:flagellar biosynthetic protein FliR
MGLWIALPLIAIMMFVNLVLGVISRVAPQTHIFAIGFPITMGVGLLSLLFMLPLMETPFLATLERMLSHFQ